MAAAVSGRVEPGTWQLPRLTFGSRLKWGSKNFLSQSCISFCVGPRKGSAVVSAPRRACGGSTRAAAQELRGRLTFSARPRQITPAARRDRVQISMHLLETYTRSMMAHRLGSSASTASAQLRHQLGRAPTQHAPRGTGCSPGLRTSCTWPGPWGHRMRWPARGRSALRRASCVETRKGAPPADVGKLDSFSLCPPLAMLVG